MFPGDVLFGPLAAAVRSAFTDTPDPNPAEGYCSEALAVRLGIAAGVLAVGIFVSGALL